MRAYHQPYDEYMYSHRRITRIVNSYYYLILLHGMAVFALENV
jgi:hypothetical protein